MDDFNVFTDLMGSLIMKYAEKINLDSLPDVPDYVEKNEEIRIKSDSKTI